MTEIWGGYEFQHRASPEEFFASRGQAVPSSPLVGDEMMLRVLPELDQPALRCCILSVAP
jgi:hypothetical protein